MQRRAGAEKICQRREATSAESADFSLRFWMPGGLYAIGGNGKMGNGRSRKVFAGYGRCHLQDK